VLGLRLPDGPLHLACLGAHCDDVPIGAGATILRLLAEHPGSHVDWLVLCSDPARADEERAAAQAFCADAATVEVHVEALPENVLPSISAEVQGRCAEMARSGTHDLVIAPCPHDLHQDHRLLAEVAAQKWRDHPIWGYEIPKWDGDLRTPNLYVRLDDDTAERKLELLGRLYPSQHDKQWYDRDAFSAVLRLRGIEANQRWAEGFHARKTAI
jgi:LmbE family N-acetylglucosaminyl deacetylase